MRNDRASVDELLAGGFERCVISPGPCTPDDAGISLEVARRLPEAGVPTLGVCLRPPGSGAGVRGQGWCCTGRWHGKAATIEHDGQTIFAGLPSPLTVGRYHSLVVDPAAAGTTLRVIRARRAAC